MHKVAIRNKTRRGTVSLEVMTKASKLIFEQGYSVRQAAESCQIACHVTLYRFVKKLKHGLPATVGYNSVQKVFSAEQEKIIAQYITYAANHYFGLAPNEIRKLAFQLASKYELVYPTMWKISK